APPGRRRGARVAHGHDRVCEHRVRRALRDGADGSEVRHRVLLCLAHGDRHAGRGDAHRDGAQRFGLPDVRPRRDDGSLLRARRSRLREGALARDREDGRLRRGDAGDRDRLHGRRPPVARPAGDRRVHRGAPAVADRGALTPVPGPETVRAFTLEIGLGALLLLVFVANLGVRGGDRRVIGWIASGGVLVLALTSFLVRPAPPALGGMFVQDGLAIFAKRLFLVATFIGLLASLSNVQPAFVRRAGEYHLLILSSLLGMFVLASARDLILLFVAFELMSIPLYVLAGFLKRQEEAVEAALKFFLVGSVSSA